jgi:hypothetical protein
MADKVDAGSGQPRQTSSDKDPDKTQQTSPQPQDQSNQARGLNAITEGVHREIDGVNFHLQVAKQHRAVGLGKEGLRPFKQPASQPLIVENTDNPLAPGRMTQNKGPSYGHQTHCASVISGPQTTTLSKANIPAQTTTASKAKKRGNKKKKKRGGSPHDQQPYIPIESGESDSDTNNYVLCGTEQTLRPDHGQCSHSSHRQ